MLGIHKLIPHLANKIDIYISLTEFARQKFIQGGLPGEKIIVKPNFVKRSDIPNHTGFGEYALYIGRLSYEKGVDILLSGWETLQIPLKIVGDGPLREFAQKCARNSSFIEYLGQVNHTSVNHLLKMARFLVFPSKLYEGLPITIIEAFSCGVPVIAADLASRVGLIRDSETGILYLPVVPPAWPLKRNGSGIFQTNAQRWEKCPPGIRKELHPGHNYQMLTDIYDRAMTKK